MIRLEIALLESEKEKLMKEFEKYKIEIPKLYYYLLLKSRGLTLSYKYTCVIVVSTEESIYKLHQ